jgi:hypothetical protein
LIVLVVLQQWLSDAWSVSRRIVNVNSDRKIAAPAM